MIDWQDIFEEVKPAPPASEADIRALAMSLAEPPTPTEVATIIARQSNPFAVNDPLYSAYQPLDPTDWQMPSAPLPPTYLEFLRWSDGPWIRQGQREFGFFGTLSLRDCLLGYHFPYCMPGAVPLGLDGGGLFAVLDTRNGPAEEYPVLAAAAGVLDYSESKVLAASFLGFCKGTTSVADILFPPRSRGEDPSRPVTLILVSSPASTKHISALHRTVSPSTPLAEFLAICRNAPTVLLDSVPHWRSQRILRKLPPEVATCIRVEDPPASQ